MAKGKFKNERIDDILRKCIRERDNWTCQKSGFIDANGQMTKTSHLIDTCHIYGRRTLSMRWYPDNMIALKKEWHQYFTTHPAEFRKFVEKMLGIQRYLALGARSCSIDIKYTDRHKRGIYDHFCREFDRMCELRNDGKQGRLYLEAFD